MIVLIASALGWRMAFLIPAVVGLVWLIPWLALFPKHDVGRGPAAQDSGSVRCPR